MFAGTVVVDCGGRFPGLRHGMGGSFVRRPVRAAFQVFARQADLRQPGRHCLCMARLAAVRGAGQGNFRIAKAEGFRGAALYQRNRLQRFDGGTRIDGGGMIAPAFRDLARYIDDRHAAAVAAFDDRAAGDLDENRIGGVGRQVGARAGGCVEWHDGGCPQEPGPEYVAFIQLASGMRLVQVFAPCVLYAAISASAWKGYPSR